MALLENAVFCGIYEYMPEQLWHCLQLPHKIMLLWNNVTNIDPKCGIHTKCHNITTISKIAIIYATKIWNKLKCQKERHSYMAQV